MGVFRSISATISPGKGRDFGRTMVLGRNAVFSFLAIVLFCAKSTIGLALDHSGTITSNEAWYPKDNPHNITGHLTVSAGDTLTIEDGVEVLVGNQVFIYIYGTLTAAGNPGTGILFSKGSTNLWDGIHFLDAGSGVFEYCTIEHVGYGYPGISSASSGTVAISNSTIRNCTPGISATAGIISLTDVSLSEVGNGISASGCVVQLASISLENIIGTGFSGNAVIPTFIDANMEFDNCGTGIEIRNIPGLNLTSFPDISNCGVGLKITDCETPTLDNLVLTGNGVAVRMINTGEFYLGPGNVIGGTGLENGWPVSMDIGAFPAAGCVIPTSGNDNNDILVDGNSSSGRTITWRKFTDLDFVVNSHITVLDSGSLTIEDDINVFVGNQRLINIYGTLTAVGTPGNGIMFTPPGPTVWDGIHFYGSGSGMFEHCTIERVGYGYAGISTSSTGTVLVSNTTIRDGSAGVHATDGFVTLADVSISDLGNGISASGCVMQLANVSVTNISGIGFSSDGMLPAFLDANTEFDNCGTGVAISNIPSLSLTSLPSITNCGDGVRITNCDTPALDNLVLTGNDIALRFYNSGEFTLGSGNVIGGGGLENGWPVTIDIGSFPSGSCEIPTSGNDNNGILVGGNGSSDRTVIWRKFTDLDFVVAGHSTVLSSGSLTIEDGINVLFDYQKYIQIYGTLTAVGTPGTGITFNKSGTMGWDGIHFLGAGSGVLDHCTIEGVGSPTSTAGVFVNSTGTVSLTNTTISNCTIGIKGSAGTINFINNQIINNSVYGVYLEGAAPVFGQNLTEWNDIYGNGSGQTGKDLRNGTTDIEAHWVHWGTMDHAQVLTRIWDFHDDHSLGYVDILPFINATHDGETSDVDDPGSADHLPTAFGLHQNAPNPFNPHTVIRFDLKESTPIQLKVYDISGARVTTLLDGLLPAGRHETAWTSCDDQGRPVASGTYFYRIQAGEWTETRRMMLIK